MAVHAVPASAQVLEFKGAALGESLADWRASPFPGSASGVAPVCTSDRGAGAIGLVPTAEETKARALVCTYAYVGPDGPVARKPVPIRAGVTADHVRYVFENGRLTAISYGASSDAFDEVVARIDAQAGAPAHVRRDTTATRWGATLPRVRMQWLWPAGSVELTDPMASGGLWVTYRLNAPGPAKGAA